MTDFVHMELNTSDREGAKKFYKNVFGWKFQDMPMPDGVYTMVTGADGGIGGIQDNPMAGTPSNWLGYIGVKSLSQTVAKIDKAGGKVLVAHQEVPGMGTLAIFVDPQGATVAAWQAAPAAKADEKATKKKATKKKATKKKAAKKKTVKKATKKPAAKKQAKKKAAKKATKKPAAKKQAKKKAAKKATKKPAAKKQAKRKSKKR